MRGEKIQSRKGQMKEIEKWGDLEEESRFKENLLWDAAESVLFCASPQVINAGTSVAQSLPHPWRGGAMTVAFPSPMRGNSDD